MVQKVLASLVFRGVGVVELPLEERLENRAEDGALLEVEEDRDLLSVEDRLEVPASDEPILRDTINDALDPCSSVHKLIGWHVHDFCSNCIEVVQRC